MAAALAPDDVVRTHEEASRNSREPLLVLDPLREFLGAHQLEAPSELDAIPIGEGHSCVTFALSTSVVVRRPPRGPLPPSAHDVLREATLLAALQATPVRVPKVLAVFEDAGVVGPPVSALGRRRNEAMRHELPDP